MDKGTAIEAAKFFAEALRREGLYVEQVRLFGSQARGEAGAESDLDVAIVSPDFEGKDVFERAALTRASEIRTIRQFMVPMDVVSLTPEELRQGKSLVAHFVQEGETVQIA